jgi:hypothetical protein
MYYLTFTLPEAAALLERQGFSVTVYRDVFAQPYHHMQLVIGTIDGSPHRS